MSVASRASAFERVHTVVLGASAGGVQALATVLERLRPDTIRRFACVLHLAPDSRSLLPEVLQARVPLKVKEAESSEELRPGWIYVAPPDYHLSIEADATFSLSNEPPVLFSRPSIDVFFSSAADALGPGVLGILMTGANSDGAQGLAAIAEKGGVTMVQDPETALFPEMPRTALQTLKPDWILPLEEIAEVLSGL